MGCGDRVVTEAAKRCGFAGRPRRRVVERTLGRLMLHRRLVRDCERGLAMSEALIRWVAIDRVARRPMEHIR